MKTLLFLLCGLYANTCQVVDIESDNVVVVEDVSGHVWAFEGSEDYDINDYVSLIMYNNGTDEVVDDIIISVRYNRLP